jgi:pimeloyl-ACP methyl ester carboxylesterase
VRVPIAAVGGLPEGVSLAATIHLPTVVTPGAPVLFMFPGAGYGRRYFDLQPEGFTGYSQAEYHVAQGLVVVAMDHIGVGDSSLPEDDGLLESAGEVPRFRMSQPLTMETMAAACDAGTRAVMTGLKSGTLDPSLTAMSPGVAIGVGQSMGGHVVIVSQANHETFAALGILGSSCTQTRLTLLPGRRYPIRNAPMETVFKTALADCDMPTCFHWPEEPAALVTADMTPGSTAPWRSRTIPRGATALMDPGAVAWETANIRVPVLYACGEIDVTPDPLADVGMFRSSCDVTLLIVPRMAHMHNFAPTRRTLWRRLNDFARQVAEAANEPPA